MRLVKVRTVGGRIRRVKEGRTPEPVVMLEDNETLVGISLTKDWTPVERKTSDWTWTAHIATVLP